jgi:hypothetical protein
LRRSVVMPVVGLVLIDDHTGHWINLPCDVFGGRQAVRLTGFVSVRISISAAPNSSPEAALPPLF